MTKVSKAQRLISIMRHNPSQYVQKVICILVIALTLAGCALSFETAPTPAPVTPAPIVPESTLLPAAAATATPEGLYQPAALPDGLRDELPVMQGICYEAARDAAGRTFVLRNAIDHIHFYEDADASKLCRHPVTRYPFDFESGRVLAGFWQMGQGCTAHHNVSVTRDDARKMITLHMTFVTEGDCGYELLRPFWVSIPDAAGWEIEFVEEAA
jgi:hypothetical protein